MQEVLALAMAEAAHGEWDGGDVGGRGGAIKDGSDPERDKEGPSSAELHRALLDQTKVWKSVDSCVSLWGLTALNEEFLLGGGAAPCPAGPNPGG